VDVSESTTLSRRSALRTICCGVAAGVAGCNGTSSSDSTESPARPPTDTAAPTETATDVPTQRDEMGTIPESVEYLQNPKDVHSTLLEEVSAPDDGILIGLRLEDSTLPFTTEVYHAPEDAEVHATKTYDTQDFAEVDLVPDSPTALETVETTREDVHYATTAVAEPLTVTLVARHEGETLDWTAWSRSGHPYDGHGRDAVLSIDCYCGGETYTAPGGGTWARVIQVTPSERVDPGTAIVLNWTSGPI